MQNAEWLMVIAAGIYSYQSPDMWMAGLWNMAHLNCLHHQWFRLSFEDTRSGFQLSYLQFFALAKNWTRCKLTECMSGEGPHRRWLQAPRTANGTSAFTFASIWRYSHILLSSWEGHWQGNLHQLHELQSTIFNLWRKLIRQNVSDIKSKI
jgi:hypothetical protein